MAMEDKETMGSLNKAVGGMGQLESITKKTRQELLLQDRVLGQLLVKYQQLAQLVPAAFRIMSSPMARAAFSSTMGTVAGAGGPAGGRGIGTGTGFSSPMQQPLAFRNNALAVPPTSRVIPANFAGTRASVPTTAAPIPMGSSPVNSSGRPWPVIVPSQQPPAQPPSRMPPPGGGGGTPPGGTPPPPGGTPGVPMPFAGGGGKGFLGTAVRAVGTAWNVTDRINSMFPDSSQAIERQRSLFLGLQSMRGVTTRDSIDKFSRQMISAMGQRMGRTNDDMRVLGATRDLGMSQKSIFNVAEMAGFNFQSGGMDATTTAQGFAGLTSGQTGNNLYRAGIQATNANGTRKDPVQIAKDLYARMNIKNAKFASMEELNASINAGVINSNLNALGLTPESRQVVEKYFRDQWMADHMGVKFSAKEGSKYGKKRGIDSTLDNPMTTEGQAGQAATRASDEGRRKDMIGYAASNRTQEIFYDKLATATKALGPFADVILGTQKALKEMWGFLSGKFGGPGPGSLNAGGGGGGGGGGGVGGAMKKGLIGAAIIGGVAMTANAVWDKLTGGGDDGDNKDGKDKKKKKKSQYHPKGAGLGGGPNSSDDNCCCCCNSGPGQGKGGKGGDNPMTREGREARRRAYWEDRKDDIGIGMTDKDRKYGFGGVDPLQYSRDRKRGATPFLTEAPIDIVKRYAHKKDRDVPLPMGPLVTGPAGVGAGLLKGAAHLAAKPFEMAGKALGGILKKDPLSAIAGLLSDGFGSLAKKFTSGRGDSLVTKALKFAPGLLASTAAKVTSATEAAASKVPFSSKTPLGSFTGAMSSVVDGADTSSSGGGTPTPGNVNDAKPGQVQKYMINQLAALGLTNEQIAGILTNIDSESSFDPTVRQHGGGPGRGLAQWSAGGGRWDELRGWAKKNKKDPWSAETQVEFMIREMQGKQKWDKFKMSDFKKTSSALDAAKYFGANYEAFGDAGTRFNSDQVQHWMDVVKRVRSNAVDSSKSVGDWNVSRDQTARIHAGEMVVPAQFANALRQALKDGGFSGGNGGTINVNVTLNNSSRAEATRLVNYVADEFRRMNRLDALAGS